jgi:hypothetical protein
MFTLTVIEFILIIIWLLGMLTSNTFGGLIHIFLAVAIMMILSQVISGGGGGGGDNY